MRHPESTGRMPALGGQVTIGTTLTLVAGDQVGTKATAGVVTMVFTPPSGILQNGVITITTPFNYFATRAAGAAVTGGAITCATACGTVTMGSVEVTNTPATSSAAAFGTITVAVTGGAITTANGAVTLSFAATQFTTGTPQVAGSVTVSTTQDRVSATGTLTALGGRVIITVPLSFSADQNRRGQWVTSSPVSIVFTPPSGILQDGVISIRLPWRYFAVRSAGLALAGSTITCATACASVTVGNVQVVDSSPLGNATGAFQTLTVVVAGASITAANGAVSLTLGAGTLATNDPQAGSSTGLTVSTQQDMVSLGAAVPSTALAACPAIPPPPASTGKTFALSALMALSCVVLLC